MRKELGLDRPAKPKEAEALLHRKLVELEKGYYYELTKMTVAEYLKEWLDDCKSQLRQTTCPPIETIPLFCYN